MNESSRCDAEWSGFSLLGGPLHRLGARVGLVREHSNTVRLGLVIGLAFWAVGAALALLEGRTLFTLAMLGAHVRLLLAIPLLFVAESLLDPRLDAFMRVAVRSRIVPGKATSALLEELARVQRCANAAWPDALCLLLALALHWLRLYLPVPGLDSSAHLAGNTGATLAGTWYSLVCLTVMRFLILRWIFRLLLWWRSLWFMSRLPLRLIPTHADGVAGLGGLDMVQFHFAPLVLAISAVLSASFAVDIAAGAMSLNAVLSAAGAILLLDALLFVAPLLLFTPPLWTCKVKGLGRYMTLAENYSADFERKWLRGEGPQEELLGTSDIQSLADLTTAMSVVREMRVLPASTKTMTNLALVALLPLLPLALFKYPLADLTGQILARLVGV
jgi:hypothetical protein